MRKVTRDINEDVRDRVRALADTEAFRQSRRERKKVECPSSDDLRLIRRFEKGGSGSFGLEIMQPAIDAASGGLRWCRV
jgi:hypothetical protein